MAVIEGRVQDRRAQALDCVQCHTDALTHQAPRNDLGPVSFGRVHGVHEDEINPFQTSVHAKGQGRQAGHVPRLHGNIHTTPRSNSPDAPMSDVNRSATAAPAHEDMMEGYLSSVQRRRCSSRGLTEASPACTTATAATTIQRHVRRGRAHLARQSPETAARAHQGVLKEWDESAHGALWREGKDGPVCSTCHEAMRIERPDHRRGAGHTCQRLRNCHADLFKSFHDSFTASG